MYMGKEWAVIWSDKLATGSKKIDAFHKEILDDVVELYKMLEDSTKFKDEIPELTKKIEAAMFAHMDLEISLLKEINLPGWEEHQENHNFYKKKYDFYKKYSMRLIIRAVLTAEIANDYMKNHFPKFDIRDIPKIKESHEKREINN